MINIDKEKSPEANWIKKVIAILENDIYDSLIMYGEEAGGKT
jgi:hypothetical protein